MRKFAQNKLWRDKAIEQLESKGSCIHWRKLSIKEFQAELKGKLQEEVDEVLKASSDDELIEELADVIEVVESLAKANGFSMSDITVVKDIKKQKRGGFSGRKYVEIAEHPIGSHGERYCLNQPEKYPEIK